MPASATKVDLQINVGPLNGLASFCLHTARTLKHFSDLYREGYTPEVEWDLTNVESRHMNMAGLTAFLSTAHRLRKYTDRPQRVLVRWDPKVFSFWEDISLFRITKQYDLLKWPESVGGLSLGETNPDTELLVFPFRDVPDKSHLDYWKKWKDRAREKFKDDLILRCGRLFQPSKRRKDFPQKLIDELAITCAELVVNSLLWGRSAAFVGLQRSGKGITMAVCDSGRGFIKSLYDQPEKSQEFEPKNHLEALALGALINTREFGLRRVINMVIENGGWIVMSSFDADIVWKAPLWRQATLASKEGGSLFNVRQLMKIVNRPIKGKASLEDQQRGFCRESEYGLRGSRIAFEIPLF